MSAQMHTDKPATMLGRLLNTVHSFFTLPLAVILLIGGLFVLATWFGWRHWEPQINAQQRFQLSAERIRVVPPQPKWIQADVKAAAIEIGNLADLSLRDKKLVERVQAAFRLQSWVADVERVTKHADGVDVVLVYRRPVAMVEVGQEKPGLLPVDADANWLPPEDFSEGQIDDFLRVVADNSGPAGPVGTYWGDERIRGGAKIAALLSTMDWKDLGLYRVKTRASGGSRGEAPYEYDLVTRDLFRIRWGFPPGQEADDEASATTKLSQLVAFAKANGGLKGAGSLGSELDLTDPRGARLVNRPTVRIGP